jgi:hypothetical protein
MPVSAHTFAVRKAVKQVACGFQRHSAGIPAALAPVAQVRIAALIPGQNVDIPKLEAAMDEDPENRDPIAHKLFTKPLKRLSALASRR